MADLEEHGDPVKHDRQQSALFGIQQRLEKLRWNHVLAASAGLILLAAAVIYLLVGRNPEVAEKAAVRPETREEALEQLAAVDAPAFMTSSGRPGKKDELMEKFQQGMQGYAEEDYQEAIRLLEEALELDPNHQPSSFYLGIAYLMKSMPDPALVQLQKLATPASNSYAHESRWFSAKAYLQKKDLVSARRELELVVESEGVHSAEARKLIQKIDALR